MPAPNEPIGNPRAREAEMAAHEFAVIVALILVVALAVVCSLTPQAREE